MTVQNLPARRTVTAVAVPAAPVEAVEPTAYRLVNPWNRPLVAAHAVFLAAVTAGIVLAVVTGEHIEVVAGVILGAVALLAAVNGLHGRYERGVRSRSNFRPAE